MCLSLLHNVKMTYALEHVMLFVSNNNIISSYSTIILYDHHNKIKYEIYLMKHHKYDGLDECLIFLFHFNIRYEMLNLDLLKCLESVNFR